mmetsp:Transcript_42487/g.96164  ORF Transcript_42487/g.96164 Transcript_42487/m.96164 type:complete len:357 (-) Transcript_42487:69-1139(-)
MVLSEKPTTALIFSRKAILSSLDALLSSLPSFSESDRRPLAKPVALLTAVKTSCRKRKGGLERSFSVILGFSIRAPTREMVTLTSPVHCSTNCSYDVPPGSGPITSTPPDRGATSPSLAVPLRCPPPRLGGGLDCAAALSGPGASASLAPPSALASGGGSSLAPAAAEGSGCWPACARCTAAWLCAGEHDFAAEARLRKKRLVFSGSSPATTLPALTSSCSPRAFATQRITRSRYSNLACLSLTSLPLRSSGRSEKRPSANFVCLVIADTTSCTKRKGGFSRSLFFSSGFANRGCTSAWTRATSSARDIPAYVGASRDPRGLFVTAFNGLSIYCRTRVLRFLMERKGRRPLGEKSA